MGKRMGYVQNLQGMHSGGPEGPASETAPIWKDGASLLEVMLIEDSRGDAILASYAFAGSHIANNVTLIESGEDALALLMHSGREPVHRTPHIIFLDLNLPRMNGWDVVQTIRECDALRRIPVIVMSSSNEEIELIRDLQPPADGYIVKPIATDQFESLVRTLCANVSLPDAQMGWQQSRAQD
jgi:CheY-like chemotaxis protein